MSEDQIQDEEIQEDHNTDQTFELVRVGANIPAELYPDQRIRTIRNFVAAGKNVSIAELSAFMAICHRYDLDPLMKEIWLVPMKGGKLTAMTGRDSFVKTAERRPGFAGIEQGVVRENDVFSAKRVQSLLPDGTYLHDVHITHEITGVTPEQRGPVVGAFCVAYHDTRKPVLIVRATDDYKHLMNRDVWKQYLEDMIETRAITAALRRQFSLAGLLVEREIADDDAVAQNATDAKQAELKKRLEEMSDDGGEADPIAQVPLEDVEEADFSILTDEEIEGPLNLFENGDVSTPEDSDGRDEDLNVPELRSKIALQFKAICIDCGISSDGLIDGLRREILGSISTMKRDEALKILDELTEDREAFKKVISDKKPID